MQLYIIIYMVKSTQCRAELTCRLNGYVYLQGGFGHAIINNNDTCGVGFLEKSNIVGPPHTHSRVAKLNNENP